MARTWVYKATETKVNLDKTRRLAEEFHFLCHALYTGGHEKRRTRRNTRKVNVGDVIHVYFRALSLRMREPESIGTYRVVGPERYPELFGDHVEETSLVVVKDPALVDLLGEEHRRDPEKGYEPDPVHEAFTGWVIEPADLPTPPYPEEFKRKKNQRNTLSPMPEARPAETPPSGTRWSRITFDPDVMGGKPCIRGMRVTVGTIVGLLAAGRSVPEILKAYPYLREDDIRDALAYAAWRAQEQDLPFSTA